MSWPLSHEFNEAIQNPQTAFNDPDLKGGVTVVGATGLPLPRSGNFADVYQVRGADGQEWAVKCFTRPVAGIAERYDKVSKALAGANLPFTVGFKFLAEGIRVGGVWRPIVKMEWVEGLLLNQVVRENAGKPTVISALGQMWVKLCKRLREAGIAHADIQHGNVLLVPGSRQGAYGLKLIDYDGMWVPALTNTPSGESGHPSYQHPTRASTRAYSPDVDRFPHLVVATALKGLAVGGAALWGRYDNGDNLLFTEGDYKKPSESALMKELWRTEDPAVQAFVGRLAIACGKPIPQTPWLDQFAPDGDPALLDGPARREAVAALGISAPVAVAVTVAAVEVIAATVTEPVEFSLPEPLHAKTSTKEEPEPDEEHLPARSRRSKSDSRRPQSRKQIPAWVWAAAAAAVAAVVCVVAVAVVLLSLPKPDQTAQTKTGEEPDPVPPRPKEITPKPLPIQKKEADPVSPKPKEKEPDPVSPKPKDDDQPKQKDPPRGPVVLKPVWSVSAESEGAPVTLQVRDQTILWGGPRTSLAAFDLRAGEKRPPFGLIDLTGGDVFCPLDGGRVAKHTPDDADIRTWDVKTGKPGEKFPVGALPPGMGVAQQRLAWLSPNGRYVVVARGILPPVSHPEVVFRAFATENPKKAIVDATWGGGSVHFTADSSRVLVAECSGRFRWFSLSSDTPETVWNYPAPANGRSHIVTDLTADGRVIGYNGPARGTDSGPCLVDGKSGDVLHRFGEGYAANSPVVLSGDGRLAAVLKEPAEGEVTIEVLGVMKGEVVARATTAMTGTLPTFTLSDDGRVLLVHNPKSGKLERFDLP